MRSPALVTSGSASGNAVLAGLFIGWAAIATKAALNEFAGGDTGYILLMAAAVLAAWFAGLIGGITAVIATVTLNAVVFLGGGCEPIDAPRARPRDRLSSSRRPGR